MEYGLPKKPKPEEDEGYSITFAGTGETYVFTDRWDRAVAFRDLGAFCLKIFDNDNGLVEAWIQEEEFNKVVEFTGTEPHEKTKMTPQEQEAFRKSRGE